MTKTNGRNRGPRTPIAYNDDRGVPCLRVPLDDRGRNYAEIERSHHDHITQTVGCNATWCLTSNGSGRRYVVVNQPRVKGQQPRLITVARLIMSAGGRQTVRYLTDDTCDLRTTNLTLGAGSGRSRHAAEKSVSDAVKRKRAATLKKRDSA